MKHPLLLALCVAVPSLASAEPLDEAKLLLKKRKYADAIAALEPLSKADATGETTYSLAIAYDLSGNSVKAIENYRKVVDGKGKRAADAEKPLKALEAIAADAASVERAKLESERTSLEGSTRLKEARARGDAARDKLTERERNVSKKQREVEGALADNKEASASKARAEKILSGWKNAGLAAPAGKGRGLRTLGTVLTAFGGIGLGASLWYAWTAQTATDEINMAPDTGMWTNELEHYSLWGETSNNRLPYSLVLGGGATLFGLTALGFGEAALDDTADQSDLTREVGP